MNYSTFEDTITQQELIDDQQTYIQLQPVTRQSPLQLKKYHVKQALLAGMLMGQAVTFHLTSMAKIFTNASQTIMMAFYGVRLLMTTQMNTYGETVQVLHCLMFKIWKYIYFSL